MYNYSFYLKQVNKNSLPLARKEGTTAAKDIENLKRIYFKK